jgi:hypothetical protein
MNRRTLPFAIAIVCTMTGAAGAAEKSFSVTGAGCDYKVRFDPAKVDGARLRDTADLILGQALPSPDFQVHPPSDIYTEALVKADYEACLKPGEAARKLAFIDMPGVEDLRSRRLDQIADTCAYEQIKGRALIPGASAKILLEHKASAQACGRYVQALDDPAGLRAFWRAQVDKRCKINSDPARCRKDSLSMEKQPDADRLIRTDLITYDWNNCAIEFLRLNQDQKRDEEAQQALVKSFRKAFKTKETCEDG